MPQIQLSGKTVDECVIEALKKLNKTYDEVNVEIVQQGTKGILGIGAKEAIVLVTTKEDPEGDAKQYLSNILQKMGLKVAIETKREDKQLYINLKGEDMGILIGKRGQTLDALQYLVNLVTNKSSGSYVSVTLDTENYRKRRKDTLESLAMGLAKKVKQTRKNVTLEPMSPYERRIIHAVLQNDKYVTTYSEGEEPYRNVVISLK